MRLEMLLIVRQAQAMPSEYVLAYKSFAVIAKRVVYNKRRSHMVSVRLSEILLYPQFCEIKT
ncbi:MAG: hypothetical protein Phog2KO_09390 [Phototrophicaceae bacterium]